MYGALGFSPFPREGGFACCTPLGARQWMHARASVYGVYAALHEFLREGDSEVDGSCLDVLHTVFYVKVSLGSCVGITAVVVLRPLSLGASSHFGVIVLHQTTGVLSSSVLQTHCSKQQGCTEDVPNLQGQVAVALFSDSAHRKISSCFERGSSAIVPSSPLFRWMDDFWAESETLSVDDTRSVRQVWAAGKGLAPFWILGMSWECARRPADGTFLASTGHMVSSSSSS